jgi:HTH-type transcriptional regulator/antitoxin HipB
LSLYDDIMQVRNTIEIGGYIRQRRTDLGMNQASLARSAGVSRQWLVAVEQGKDTAEVGRLLRTLHALGVALDLAPAEAVASTVDLDRIIDG